MDFSRLENNIIDILTEEQIKLGYRSESVRLYYPMASLNTFFSASFTIEEMQQALQAFSAFVRDRLGDLGIANNGQRFCITIPPQGADYVHAHLDNSSFICDFIRTIERHGCTIDEVIRQFYKHSDEVHVEKAEHGEFDYLIYFTKGQPDDFRYCITEEGRHLTYHRFTPEDYNALFSHTSADP